MIQKLIRMSIFLIPGFMGLSRADADFIQWRMEDGGNGHYYGLVLPSSPSGNLTWFQAHDSAANATFLGSSGHLVTITSAEEDAFIQDSFETLLRVDFDSSPANAGDFAWLGLTDVLNEGNYRWITGEPFSYSNWGLGEPNNLFDEDYVHLWRRDYQNGAGPIWSWNDSDPGPVVARWDSARFGYIVEFDGPFVNSVPEPSALVLFACGMVFMIAMRSLLIKRATY